MKRLGKIEQIVVHHSGTAAGNVERFRASHRQRGYADIGYHWLIGNGNGAPDGVLKAGRSDDYQGAAVWGNNAGKLHVVLCGHFGEIPPTSAQLNRLGEFLVDVCTRSNLPASAAVGHREIALPGHGTLCPGQHFPLGKVRAWLHVALEGGEVPKLAEFCAVVDLAPLPNPVPPQVTHSEVKCKIEVTGWLSGTPKKVIEPDALLIGGRTYICLRDVAEGLDWAEPVMADGVVTVRTKRTAEGGE